MFGVKEKFPIGLFFKKIVLYLLRKINTSKSLVT